MVAILAGLKWLFFVMPKALFVFGRASIRFIGIGLLAFLFIIAAWHSIEARNPTPFLKEFGGRIFLTDLTVEEDINYLKANPGLPWEEYLYQWLLILSGIFAFYYLIKIMIWLIRNVYDRSMGTVMAAFIAITILATFETFYILYFVGSWRIPFIGFFVMVQSFVPLIIQPFTDWVLSFIPIEDVPTTANQTMGWWERIFG